MANPMKSHDRPADEPEDAQAHANPAKGGKSVDGSDRANVTPVAQGCGVAEADKKL